MSGDAIQRLLNRVTYKPGWQFQQEFDVTSGRARVVVSFRALDATGREPGLIRVMREFDVPTGCSSERLIELLYENLAQLEIHELHEWLRVDGTHYVKPH